MDVVKRQKALGRAIFAIKNGEVIICPTDTVYGFLADASNKKAVDKIYRIKKRPRLKPLPIFVKDLKMAKELAEINKEQEKIIKKYWPGKYTFILKRMPGVKLFGQDKKTIAIRIPKYKLLDDLLKKIDRPLVQTSVNISGERSMIKINEIGNKFEKAEGLIVDAGSLPKRKASIIMDLTKSNIKFLRK